MRNDDSRFVSLIEVSIHLSPRADMWAILGIWAVQQTIDNNNVSAVPDLQVDYTYGRVVRTYVAPYFNICTDLPPLLIPRTVAAPPTPAPVTTSRLPS